MALRTVVYVDNAYVTPHHIFKPLLFFDRFALSDDYQFAAETGANNSVQSCTHSFRSFLVFRHITFTMRWSSIFLPFTLLAAGVLAEPASKQFQEFHKKALASAPIKLEDASYKKVTALPRDYSVAVLLTAMDNRYACQMCREFGPEWDLLANSWTKGDKKGESKVIFATLDFNDGRDTFMSVSITTPHSTMLRSHLLTKFLP